MGPPDPHDRRDDRGGHREMGELWPAGQRQADLEVTLGDRGLQSKRKRPAPEGRPSIGCRKISVLVYCSSITTRRLRGSRTPSGVGTAGSLSPRPTVTISFAGTPSLMSSALTAAARR